MITIHVCGVDGVPLEDRWAMDLCDAHEAEHELEQDLAIEAQLASALDCPWCEALLSVACECRERNPAAIEVEEPEVLEAAVALCIW